MCIYTETIILTKTIIIIPHTVEALYRFKKATNTHTHTRGGA